MCRSIKQLRGAEQPPTNAEIEAAALQYVRKISGYRAPSRTNKAAFDKAVAEIAASTRRMLDEIGSPAAVEAHPTTTLAATHPVA